MTRAQIEYLLDTYGKNNLAKIYFTAPCLHSVNKKQENYTFDHVREILSYDEFTTASDTNNFHSAWFKHCIEYANIGGLIFYNAVQAPPPVS